MKRRKRKIDINTLVALVANTMGSDQTLPIPGDSRKGWESDQLLIGMVDKLMTYRLNDPAGYAKIGRRVAARVNDLPVMVVLAKLAEFRGERLLSVSEKRKQNLLLLSEEIALNIAALPDDSRKERCKSLFTYHQGVSYDAYEMFAAAANMQVQSAEIAQANGDKSGAAIGYFLQAVYQLKDALCQPSTDEAEAVFSIMEERYAKLVEAVRGTALEVSWGQGNAPCHMIEACIWLGRDHPQQGAWVALVTTAGERLGDVWKPIAEFVCAAYLDNDECQEANVALQAVVNDAKQSNEIRATALLALARRALAERNPKLAKRFIRRMPKRGASHIRAIAERLMQ